MYTYLNTSCMTQYAIKFTKVRDMNLRVYAFGKRIHPKLFFRGWQKKKDISCDYFIGVFLCASQNTCTCTNINITSGFILIIYPFFVLWFLKKKMIFKIFLLLSFWWIIREVLMCFMFIPFILLMCCLFVKLWDFKICSLNLG